MSTKCLKVYQINQTYDKTKDTFEKRPTLDKGDPNNLCIQQVLRRIWLHAKSFCVT